MKIVNIFVGKLFSIVYSDEQQSEYQRLMEEWEDPESVENFLKTNFDDLPGDADLYQIVDDIIDESYFINEKLINATHCDDLKLDHFFAPLDNLEYKIIKLSFRKGKADKKPQYLRLYAIRIDVDVYVITGGAIKLPLQHRMQDREHTKKELDKLARAQSFLKLNNVHDDDSFFEFLDCK